MKTKFTTPYLITGLIALIGGAQIINQTAAAITTQNAKKIAYKIFPCFYTNNLDKQAASFDTTAMTTSPRPISAIEHKTKLLYICDTGDTICRTKGSRAWRNNNPGCIVYGDFAIEKGAIGKGGKFAVFPDEATGRAALAELLRGGAYINLTIEHAIRKYAPPYENDVELYKRKLRNLTGLPLNLKLHQLAAEQMERVVNAICIIEGWIPGKETVIGAAKKSDESKIAAAHSNTLTQIVHHNTQKTL